MAKAKWERTGGLSNNAVLRGDGFYISYAENPGAGISFFASDGGSDETALVVGDNFHILNGDFRDQYEAAVAGGLAACMAVFDAHKARHASSWDTSARSETPPDSVEAK
jgi:hypothetical protein